MKFFIRGFWMLIMYWNENFNRAALQIAFSIIILVFLWIIYQLFFKVSYIVLLYCQSFTLTWLRLIQTMNQIVAILCFKNFTFLETVTKKMTLVPKYASNKKSTPQCLTYLYETLSKWLSHGQVILLETETSWAKIVQNLSVVHFLVCVIFFRYSL